MDTLCLPLAVQPPLLSIRRDVTLQYMGHEAMSMSHMSVTCYIQ